MKKTTRKLSLKASSVKPLIDDQLVSVAGAWSAAICSGGCTYYCDPTWDCYNTFQSCPPCATINHNSCPSCPC